MCSEYEDDSVAYRASLSQTRTSPGSCLVSRFPNDISCGASQSRFTNHYILYVFTYVHTIRGFLSLWNINEPGQTPTHWPNSCWAIGPVIRRISRPGIFVTRGKLSQRLYWEKNLLERSTGHILGVSVNSNSFCAQCSVMASATLTRDRVLHYLPRQVKFYSLSFHTIDIKQLFQRNKQLYYLERCPFTDTWASQQHKYLKYSGRKPVASKKMTLGQVVPNFTKHIVSFKILRIFRCKLWLTLCSVLLSKLH